MTDIEKVRAFISKTITELHIYAPDKDAEGEAYESGRLAELLNIREFIDSLQSEPDADLEQAAIKFASFPILAGLYDKNTKMGFVAGAQWQLEQMMKEAISAEIKKGRGKRPILLPAFFSSEFGVIGDTVKLLIFPADA